MSVVETPLVEFLRDGANAFNMAIEGDVTPTDFSLVCPANTRYTARRIVFYMEDSGAFDATDFGNGIALTTGISLKCNLRGVETDLFGGVPLTQNGHFSRLAFDTVVRTWGTGPEFLAARYTFAKFFKDGIPMITGDSITMEIRDDLTGLIELSAVIEGESAVYS